MEYDDCGLDGKKRFGCSRFCRPKPKEKHSKILKTFMNIFRGFPNDIYNLQTEIKAIAHNKK